MRFVLEIVQDEFPSMVSEKRFRIVAGRFLLRRWVILADSGYD